MSLGGLPSLVAPQPPPGDGAQGAKGHRPSVKELESKDIIKAFGESMSFGKRMNLPRGMLYGGGSADYVARNSLSSTNLKVLTWALTTDRYDDNSLVMRGTRLLGPLAKASASADAAATPGFDQYHSGAPVSLDAIRRAAGAFTFQQESIIFYNNNDAAASHLLNISMDASVPTGSLSAELLQQVTLDLNDDKKVDWTDTFPHTGFVKISNTTKLSPVLAADGAVLSSSINVYQLQEITIIPTTNANPQVAHTQKITRFLVSTVPVDPGDQWMYLNVYACMNVASGANYIVRLQDSRGYTVAGHDGFPFDSYQ